MSQPQQLQVILEFLKTNYKFDVFQEPRGVMRIFQFVFAIWSFFAARDFSLTFNMDCNGEEFNKIHKIDYPFTFAEHICRRKDNNQTFFLAADISSDAQFYVITAILSVLYALFIILVYIYVDDMYKSKPEFAMADFAITAILAGFWLMSSFAFSNGGSALKRLFDPEYIARICSGCDPKTSSFTDLNIALMIGFLNFFLWASDLWFVYKETIWFQQRNAVLNQPMYGQQQQFAQQPQYGEQSQYADQPQYGEQSYGQQQFAGQQQSYGQPGI